MARQGKFSQPRTAAPAQPEPKPERKPKPEKKPKPLQPPAPVPEPAPEEAPLTPAQRAWETVQNLLTTLVMLLAVAMVIFTVFSMRNFDRNDRDIFGYKAFIVRSDSMSATDFAAGDLVLVKECDPATLAVGDIISFRSEDPSSYGETFTHKIRAITEDDYGQHTFTTYGTTNNVDDLYPVPQANVLGVYIRTIPKLGLVLTFIKTPAGYVACILLPIMLMLLIQGASSVNSARQIYKEKQDEQEAEHQRKLSEMAAHVQAMEDQRRQMEAMLAEMRRLQSRPPEDPPQPPEV